MQSITSIAVSHMVAVALAVMIASSTTISITKAAVPATLIPAIAAVAGYLAAEADILRESRKTNKRKWRKREEEHEKTEQA